MTLSLSIPQPDGLEFEQWACVVAEQLASYGVGPPSGEWRQWASSLFYVPALTALNIPSPEGFADWQTWAFRFFDCVR